MKERIQEMMERFIAQWQQLKQDLAGMSFGQKLQHLATYYWYVPVVAAVVVFAIWFAGNAATYSAPTSLIYGISLNVQVCEPGSAYLTEEFQAFCGSEASASLDTLLLADADSITYGYLDESTATLLMTRSYAQELDYLLLDKTMFSTMGTGYFIDLRELFTEEELSGWTLVYKTDGETGESYPVGFDITPLPFAHDCIQSGDGVYLTATSGTVRVEAFKNLLTALKQWQSG